MEAPAVLLVMGVSGSGKSTVGALLASKVKREGQAQTQDFYSLPASKPRLPFIPKLGWKFYDADDYHSEENRMKMGRGVPLSDQDRIPWLCSLHDILLRAVASGQRVVLACSALKKTYRDILTRGRGAVPVKGDESAKERLAGEQLLVVYLCGSFETISRRLSQRKGHFMPPELLQSQFGVLEPPSGPENFLQVSVDQKSPAEIADAVMEALQRK
ncbi:probable gluconokinase isoform X2 [Mesocricetus auratus]|uniref:Gluconokinase n=1 Tax=Mesocricetus auratus TaxID=10036 RepID=A0ABM2YE04_MESAU|nr:probable gluconokinase isoform X2 [Mesocricetus auratus]